MKTTVRLLIVLVLSALVFGGVIGFKFLGGKTMEGMLDSMSLPPATVSATEATSQQWPRRIAAVGSLVAVNGVEVTTEAEGIVKSIHFESGDRAEKGSVLLRLDADTDRADLRTLEAQSALARTDLKRLKELYELESISRSEYDKAKSEAEQARARVAAQRARVQRKTIIAPFDGELGIRKVNVGEFLEKGKPIVSLQSLDPLYVDFSLPEKHVSQVRVGGPVQVTSDLYPDEIYSGAIQALEPSVDAETRNFMVRARIPNSDGKLRPGVFARVQVILPGEDAAVIIPRTAVSYNPYGNAVFVIVENQPEDGEPMLVARQRFIKTGEARGDFIVVLSGLEEGEQVATSGLLKLRNDQPVVINNELAPDVQQQPTPEDS